MNENDIVKMKWSRIKGDGMIPERSVRLFLKLTNLSDMDTRSFY